MLDSLHFTAQTAFAWLLVIVAASWLSAFGYPLYRTVTAKLKPGLRASGILIYGLVPLVAAVGVILELMLPGVLPLQFNHCHGAVCIPHVPPLITASTVGAILAIIATILTLALVVLLGLNMQRQRAKLMTLDRLSKPHGNPDYRILESSQPLAWCGGLWRPKIYLSRGLLAQLDQQQLQVVLAHEQTHARQRDNLRKTILHWASQFWLGEAKTAIREDFAAACEQLCDANAARLIDDPSLVCRTLDKLSRASAATVADLPTRTAQLADPPCRRSAIGGWLLIALLLAVELSFFTGITHLLLERLTSLP